MKKFSLLSQASFLLLTIGFLFFITPSKTFAAQCSANCRLESAGGCFSNETQNSDECPDQTDEGGNIIGKQVCCTPNQAPSNIKDPSLHYDPLEKLPGFESQSTDFLTYLKNLYLLALWIVGICALFMLVLGGFLYLSSAGNTSQIGYAKKTIYSAIIGLVIALISWLILDTINPDLTTISLSGLSPTAPTSTSPGGGTNPPTPASGDVDAEGCKALSNNASSDQCGLASKELVTILSCMRQRGITNSISAITSHGVGNNQQLSAQCCDGTQSKDICPHSTSSCHNGCNYGTKGLSYAADIAGINTSSNDATLCAIAEAAKTCGAGGSVWGPRSLTCNGVSITKQPGHETHMHISTSGCNH